VTTECDQSVDEERRLRTEKLQHEVTIARYQASPEAMRNERRKAWTAVTGLIVATVAVGSLLVTMAQWLKSSADAQASRRQERLERSIAALASADRFARLSAIAALRQFSRDGNAEQQEVAIGALVSALSVETSPLVRDSLRSALTSSALPISTRNVVLRDVVQASRGLLAEFREAEEPSLDAVRQRDIRVRARAVAETLIDLLHGGAQVDNLDNAYLEGGDFRRMNLSGVSFDNAFLPGADFSGAYLDRASFRDATLIMTRFRGARLRNAILTISELAARNNYAAGGTDAAIGADFTCADLRNANLRGQPVFVIIEDGAAPVFISSHFEGANLKNADIEEARMLAFVRYSRNVLQMPLYPSNPSDTLGRREGVLVYSLVDTRWPYRPMSGFGRTPAANRFLFSSTNWKEAHLPASLNNALIWAEVPSVVNPDCAAILQSDLHGASLMF